MRPYPTIHHLSEAYGPKETVEGEERAYLIDVIRRNCAPFLHRWDRSAFLFRGVHTRATLDKIFEFGYTEVRVRQDRRPFHSKELHHVQLGRLFQRDNFIARRDNSVFVTGHHLTAVFYDDDGVAQVVFPIGPYNFTWSDMVGDMFTLLQNDPSVRERLDQHDPTLLTSLRYRQNDDINKAIHSECEIMLQCERVLLVNHKIAQSIVNEI